MIELDSVSIRAGEHYLSNISLRVETGQYVALMGKTGIGKTTILEAICGLRPIESGTIRVNNTNVSHWQPADRGIGYVPQDLALFPHLRVDDHLAFALKLRRTPAKEIKTRVAELAELLSISHLLKRTIQGLSGGEAKRVAVGRAISFRPAGLLLDEPLSALDDDSRQSAQKLLRNVNRETGVTVIHVTHNIEIANATADYCLQLSKDPTTDKIQIKGKKVEGNQ